MAPGKKDPKSENVLMGLVPVARKETESDTERNIVCVVDAEGEKFVINLDRKTTVMKLYKIVAEKANYMLDSFLLLFLKTSNDGKSSEEVILDNSHETTLGDVVGGVKSKTKDFAVKPKDGKTLIKRVQQATVSIISVNDLLSWYNVCRM